MMMLYLGPLPAGISRQSWNSKLALHMERGVRKLKKMIGI